MHEFVVGTVAVIAAAAAIGVILYILLVTFTYPPPSLTTHSKFSTLNILYCQMTKKV